MYSIMELFLALSLLSLCYVIFCICKLVLQKADQCCYMLAYACHKASEDQKLDTGSCSKIAFRNRNLGIEEYRFLLRTMVSSGLGEETYSPKNVVEGREESATLGDALYEMDDVIFGTLDDLFDRTGISPSQINIIVSTVSLFSPVPSLTSRIINRYKMRQDIKSFNLSGMGCSASVVAIDLVKHLFKSYKKSFAIVVSTESMGPNWYSGRSKSMMLSNILFRTGGCSMLLTNDRDLKDRAILKLTCLVRTHIGSSDEAYGCCFQIEDELGHKGFRLTRSLPKAGADALTRNLRVLLPKVLPIWELLRCVVVSYYKSKVVKKSKSEAKNPDVNLSTGIIPDINLRTGIDHFCVHPGGRAIIDEVGNSLKLSTYELEPARMALHRFGNTSAGGLWYVLGYMEAKKRLKKGDKIIMISLGAGFKCNNCVWKVMRDLDDKNVWKDCIDQYPPETLANPFSEKFDWINDPSLNFLRREDIK